MPDRFEMRDEEPQPWSTDPDAWRSASAPRRGGSWPQLDAGPIYWMWLEMLERERGIRS